MDNIRDKNITLLVIMHTIAPVNLHSPHGHAKLCR